jgi:hypothetical protein
LLTDAGAHAAFNYPQNLTALTFSIDDPDSETIGTSHELFSQVTSTQPAKPRVRAMANDDGAALLISREQEHFSGRRSAVERRRHTGMDASCGDACPLQLRAGAMENARRLPVVDIHPLALRRPQVGFDLLFALRTFRASRFKQLRWHMRRDICEMDVASIARGQNASNVMQHSLRGFASIHDYEQSDGVARATLRLVPGTTMATTREFSAGHACGPVHLPHDISSHLHVGGCEAAVAAHDGEPSDFGNRSADVPSRADYSPATLSVKALHHYGPSDMRSIDHRLSQHDTSDNTPTIAHKDG